MNNPTKCKHMKFAAQVDVGRLTGSKEGSPVTGYTADIRIKCAECGLPFRFIGLDCGDSQHEPKVSVDATELRAPIEPEYVPEILGISKVSGNA